MMRKLKRVFIKNLSFLTTIFGVALINSVHTQLVCNPWLGIVPSLIIVFTYLLLFTSEVNDEPETHWVIRRICKNDMLVSIGILIIYFGVCINVFQNI